MSDTVAMLTIVLRVIRRNVDDIKNMRAFIESSYEHLPPHMQGRADEVIRQQKENQKENDLDADLLERCASSTTQRTQYNKEESMVSKIIDFFSF